MPTQDCKIFPGGDDPTPHFLWNLGEEVNDPIDLMVVHQGIIDANDAVMPQEIIVSSFIPHIVSKSEALKEVMEDIGTR